MDEPFDDGRDAVLRALEPLLRALEPLEPLLRALLPLRLDALVLLGLLPELDDRLRELDDPLRELEALLPFDDVLRLLLREAALLGLDPFELRDDVFRLLCDRELAWAISPP